VELSETYPIFVGIKLDGSLRRRIEGLTGPDKQYISDVDSTFLRLCRLGDDDYVGKVIEERMTTDRVDDVRRNVLSILQRLFPDHRLPQHLEILACRLTSPALDSSRDGPRTAAVSN
jgi:hypothetical protein